LQFGDALLQKLSRRRIGLSLLFKIVVDVSFGNGVDYFRGYVRISVRETDIDQPRLFIQSARFLHRLDLQTQKNGSDIGSETFGFGQIFMRRRRGDGGAELQFVFRLYDVFRLRVAAETNHALDCLPGGSFLGGVAFKEVGIVFKVQGFYDAAHQAGADKNLQLGIEVDGIVSGTKNVRRLADERGVVFQIHLYASACLINIGLAGDVDDGEHRDERHNADDQPQPFAHGAPVIEQMDLGFRIQINSVVVRMRIAGFACRIERCETRVRFD
jgi:hypothetical protein